MKTHFPSGERSARRVIARLADGQSGVALVATLIMLSLVTFMVVAFLGVARRERRSVEASITQSESRMMMDSALARAQADLLARLLATGDKGNYGAMAPTNFQNPTANLNTTNPINVNHSAALAAGVNAWLTNLANLQYDPLVPVFSPLYTNRTPFAPLTSETNLGRWYLDLNRNFQFDGPTNGLTARDPHWIGVLEYPATTHHATNHFLGRYTYYIAPAGRTLDLNLIHNQAKRLVAGVTSEGYYRNLGLGPQEMNLAALLAEANPYWGYAYDTNVLIQSTFAPFTRDAHRDALNLLLFRNNNSYNNYLTMNGQFGAFPALTLASGQFDVLGDGPLMNTTALTANVDPAAQPWPGGVNSSATAQRFSDLTELFNTSRGYSGNFTTNLHFLGRTNEAVWTALGDRNRRTFYNLLNTLGVDSWPVDGRLNLNWSNAVFNSTNITIGSSGGDVFGFADWHPEYFFFNAAEMMIRASTTPVVSINTNWTGFGGAQNNVLNTNHFFGGGLEFNYVNTYFTNNPAVLQPLYAPNVGFINSYAGFWIEPNRTNSGGVSLSVTNIPIHPFSYYTPEVHRLLQFAANLYDAAGPPEWLPGKNYVGGDRVQRGGTNYVALIAMPPAPFSTPPSASWETITNSATTQIYLPTLFRPYFAFNTNSWPSNDFIKIVGYTTNLTDINLLNLPVIDLADPNSRLALYTNAAINAAGDGTNFNALIAGTPVIVGARKGYPNFNEFAMQTVFSLSRKLEYVKTLLPGSNTPPPGPLAPPSQGPRPVTTNQSLIISLFSINAFEAWNSYAAAFPRPLRIAATTTTKIVVTNENGPVFITNFVNTTSATYAASNWLGTANGTASFKSFLFTNTPHLSLTNYVGGPNPYFPTTNVFLPTVIGGPGLPGYAYATNYPPLSGLTNGGFAVAGQSTFNRAASDRFPDLRLGITITNSIVYALVDNSRVVDFVTLTNLVSGMDLAAALSSTNGNPTTDNADRLRRFFVTTRMGTTGNTNPVNPPFGLTNQFYQSTNNNLSYVTTNLAEWTGWNGSIVPQLSQIQREIERFRRFMGLLPDFVNFPPSQNLRSGGTNMQAPYTATRIVALSTSWEANDPLVHYTTRDMEDPYRTTVASRVWRKPVQPLLTLPPPPGSIYGPGYANTIENYPAGRAVTPQLLGLNKAYAPWGRTPYSGSLPQTIPNYLLISPSAYDQRLRDPGVANSDWWDFPQRRLANLGWIGRVHRGTPWQTFYLKSEQSNPTNWFYWAHTTETNPTNDWRLVDLFSTAINADATRGLLSVNQTNSIAWAAALGSTLVLSNNGAFSVALPVTPQTPQLTSIIGGLDNGLINAKQRVPMWQPVANYSTGDLVGYYNGPYGFISYFMALNGTNQNQNPFLQVATNNFTYWTNVAGWNGLTSFAANQVVVYQGVAYYSLLPVNSGNVPSLTLPPTIPAWWNLYYPSRSFSKLGYVLSTPELSVRSPYLRVGQPWQGNTVYAAGSRVYWQGWYYEATRAVPVNIYPGALPNSSFQVAPIDYTDRRVTPNSSGIYWWPLEMPAYARFVPDAINDVFIERIAQQNLGLLQLETSPRVKIYAYGQALRPAERGIFVGSGQFQGMVTNYQITGESAAVAVVRIDGLPDQDLLPRPLPPGAPQQVHPRVIVESFKLQPPDL